MKYILYKELLYSLREKEGYSLEEAASRCDETDKKTYWNWESGKTLRPNIRNLKIIANTFELKSWSEIILKPGEVADPYLKAKWQMKYFKSASTATHEIEQQDYKIIFFDLDGTLINGFEFSWEKVWEHVEDGHELRKEGFRRYRDPNGFSYSQWCKYCADHFVASGINREELKRIAIETGSTVKNLYPVLYRLKEAGFILVIISGGISTFLEEMIPNYEKIFDFVFINWVTFDRQGNILHIEPTPYDFEGKAEGVKHICKLLKIDENQTVFVGNSFNDEYAAYVCGLTISIGNDDTTLKQVFDKHIESNDLNNILPLIIKK